MDIDALTMSDLQYLEAVERGPFSPLGPLYTSVYEDLLNRGLVHLAAEGYIISAFGQEMLDELRPVRGTEH
jgi:hypothetical protein